MATCATLFSDGTSQRAQKMYNQLYLDFSAVSDQKLCLYCVLLRNKTIGTYHRLLLFFKRNALEKSAMNSHGICSQFGARFQFSKRNGLYASQKLGLLFTIAFLKMIKKLGLFTHYIEDPELKGFLRKKIAIAYLPVLNMHQKFIQLTQSASARFLNNYTQLYFL